MQPRSFNTKAYDFFFTSLQNLSFASLSAHKGNAIENKINATWALQYSYEAHYEI